MLLIAAGTLALLFIFPNILMGQTGVLFSLAEDFIIQHEGFLSTSKWDYQQYTWGYGTKAPGAGQQISESEARAELEAYVRNDYDYLNRLITTPLTNNQWAALLDFSYNEGRYNADNLVTNINNQDWDAFAAQVRLYNKVTINGQLVYNAGLAQRREDELNLFFS